MKKLLLFISLLPCFAGAQQIQFSNIYFNSDYYVVGNLIELNDSSYLISCHKSADPWSPSTQMLLHIKANGDTLNSHQFFYGYFAGGVLLNDSMIAIMASGWNGMDGIDMVKINFNTWDTSGYKFFGIINQGNVGGLYQTPDSGFLLLNVSSYNYGLIKTDNAFNEIWHTSTSGGSNLLVDKFSNILFSRFSPYSFNYYDSAGTLLWYSSLGGSACSSCDNTGIFITADSNFLAVTNADEWQMLKINRLNGDTIWTKQFPERINNGVNISPNRHFICTRYHFYIIDDNGDTIISKPCPITNNFMPVRSIVTKDGGLAICGIWGTGGPQWIQSPVLIKTDSLLNTVFTAVLDPGNNYQPLTFYPNPAQNELWISSNMASERGVTFTLYDMQGRIMLQQQCDGTQPVDVSAVPSGLYIGALKGKEKEVRGKVKIGR